MNRTGAAAVLAAVLVVLAGCSGGLTGGTVSPGDAGAADGSGSDGSANGAGGTGSTVAGPSGSVNFYVSDRPGDMDDFEHLNVTVTTVRFHLVDRTNGSAADGSATDGANATTTTTVTSTPTTTATTSTDEATPVVTTPADGDADAETETENESEDETEREDEGAGDDGEDADGRWVVREVDETTVDLTELRGDNATLVEAFDVPAGEYDRVFLEVSDVNATLQNGESTRVKLPSGKLQLNTEFEVEDGSEVDFVYDVMVHKAGKSGKYILRPVVSESGTDRPIDPVDERGRPVDDEGEDERDDDALTATLASEPVPGGNVTLTVTDGNGSVANATVTVNGDEVGTTDDDGTLTVTVPDDAEELEIEVGAGDREGELEREFGDGDDGKDGGDDGDGGGPPDDSPGNGNGGN